ncbi:MAG: alpha/beta hydrolase [Nocardioidaceae bacterium]
MGLLGAPLLVLLGVAAVVLPVAAVLLWSRAPRQRRTAARWVLVVAAQLAAVLVVAAAANDYGYFSGRWSGLWYGLHQAVTGTSGEPVTVVTGTRPGPDPAVPGWLHARPDPSFSDPRQWPVRGRLETVTLSGPVTGLHTLGHLYLPPQYFRKRYARTRFPAVEVFTGYPGSNRQLVKKLKYPQDLLRDLHHGRAHPAVLVMLRSSPMMPRDTECTDVPGGPQVQTFFAQDVPWEITHAYRVRPTGWGAIGDSTGGYCAAKLAMLNPYVFRAAVSLSGYFTTLHDNTTGSLWGGSPVVRHLNDLLWRLRHLPAPPVSVLVTSSRQENGRLGITNSERFLALARPPLQVSSIIEPHGGHDFTTWGPEIPRALEWLTARLPHAVPR